MENLIYEIIGWIGVLLLIFSYFILNTKYQANFIFYNMLASFILFIYSFLINNYQFIIVNLFIVLLLAKKFFKIEKKQNLNNLKVLNKKVI